MASDAAARAPLLPIAWRVALVLGLAMLAAHLLATTQYYATIFILALLIVGLVFGAARLALQSQSAADSIAANRVIARLQLEQKQAAKTQDHLQALLDTVGAALLVMEQDGRIASANRAARLLARSDGPRLSDIAAIGPAAAGEIAALAPGAHAVVRLANGQQMLVSAGQFSGGGAAQRLVSLQSVVGELDAVQIKAWEDMIRVLAHEIMNSLTPISSLSESLSGILRAENASAGTVEAMETIARRSRGLTDFVDRYRRIAELPQPRRQKVPLGALVAELDRLMRGRLGAIAYRSEVQPADLCVLADSNLLHQAMINLLHNAIDAVADAQAPAITLSCRRLDSEIAIQVADNGKGVPSQLRNDIFVPFFTTKPNGSGVGLSLARQIALAHGGRLEFWDNDQAGSIFRLTLPAG